MDKFQAVGMRTKITEPGALVINTCSGNDTGDAGDATHWSWANPTNRRFAQEHAGAKAVSTEALWQGTKLTAERPKPDERTLAGEWRRGKGKRPIGAWNGEGQPWITSPGAARRAIYLPAFKRQITLWMAASDEVRQWIQDAKNHPGTVYLRDHDTGRGVDRNGPMSHAWVLAEWLNGRPVW